MTPSDPYVVKLSVGRAALFAAPRDPQADKATLRAIQERAGAGDLPRAIAMADEALAGGLEHPMLLNLAAIGLENQGRLEEAQTRLARALELAPGDLGVLNALGLVALRLERFGEALARFDAVLAVNPAIAAAHGNRATALSGLGRLAEAEAGYHRALELQPGHLAAQAGLAAIASRRGDHAAARRLAGEVLRAEPNHPDSVMSLAAADLAQGAAGDAEASLRGLLADPRPSQLERALATGLLADVLDAQDRVPEAFEAYGASNQALQRLYAPRFAAGQSPLDVARWVAEWLGAAKPAGSAGAGAGRAAPTTEGAPTHVFLLGFPRSGTTLVEQVLAGHPDVEALEERDTLADGVNAFMKGPADLDRLAASDDAALAPWRAAYWRRAREAGATLAHPVFVDKHPFNTLKLPLIARLFPDARILFSRRDPRDVVLSCWRRRFQMSPHTYPLLTLDGAAALYAATMELAARAEAVLDLNQQVVRHEALVAQFEPQVRLICAFLGLKWTAAMGNLAARVQDRAIATPSGAQLARGLSAEGIGQWRRYRSQMAPVLPRLGPWVERFGYAAE
jgi:tetratricopeptide (TPR) repeat protein